MTATVPELQLDKLTLDQKLLLLDRVWGSILDEGPPPVPEWHLKVIRERLAKIEAGGGNFVAWEDFRKELLEEYP